MSLGKCPRRSQLRGVEVITEYHDALLGDRSLIQRVAGGCPCAGHILVLLVAFPSRPGERVLQAVCPLLCLVDLVRPAVGDEVVEHVGGDRERLQKRGLVGVRIEAVEPVEHGEAITHFEEHRLPGLVGRFVRLRHGCFHDHDPGPEAGPVGPGEHLALETLDVHLEEVDPPRNVVGHDLRERPNGHLDRSELLPVGPIARRELGHHGGRAAVDRSIGVQPLPRRSRLDEQFPPPSRRTEGDAQIRVSRTCRAEPLVFARERFHVHAPPAPLGERRSDRIQYGIPGTDVHPEALPIVRVEGTGKHHILLVLRIRHERITAHLSAPAPVEATTRSRTRPSPAVASCVAVTLGRALRPSSQATSRYTYLWNVTVG